jgi:UDP:flavonoid glycosyltransferase YjiC (YdhE family)
MARIVFLTVDGGGNLPPALAIADELAARGHRILFLGHERQRERIAAAGHDFRPYRHARPWSGEDPRGFLTDARDFVRLVSDRGYAEDLADVHREEPVDVAVIDCLIPGSIRAAAGLPMPVVALMHSIAQAWMRAPAFRIASTLSPVRMRKGWDSARLTLVTTTPELDPAYGALPDNYVWTGICEALPPSAAVPVTPPRVLISLSTMSVTGQGSVLQRLLDAVDGLPLEAIVTTGPTIEPASLRAPANVEVHRFAPHAQILPSCSLVVGHGGHSTTARALAHGVPLLVVPINELIDQPSVGKAVARTGAGLAMKKSSTPAQFRAAITTLLEDPSYRTAAAELGARIRAEGGASVAADRILQLAERTPGGAAPGEATSEPASDATDPQRKR